MITTLAPSRSTRAITPSDTFKAESAFQWLKSYTEKNGISRKEIATRIGYDESTISRIFNGRFEGNPDHVVRAIDHLRASVVPPMERVHEFPFVPTETAKSVWGYIDLVRFSTQRIGTLIGDSQSGKTRAVLEWINKNAKKEKPLDAIYIQLPVGAHKSYVIQELCEIRGVSDKYNTASRELRFSRTITPETIIFVDEIQQCASKPRSGGRMSSERTDTLTFFRRLRDTRHCTVVLLATTEAEQMLRLMTELRRRSIPTYNLAPKPTRADLAAFAAHLGLPPATGKSLAFQTATIDVEGLGYWLMYLHAGAMLAHAQERAVTWDDVHAADDIFEKAKKGGRE